MTATQIELGAYRVGEVIATSRRFEWRSVSTEASGELVAKLPRDARSAPALALEARRVAALRDEAPWAIAPLLDALAGESGPAALIYARARGTSLAGAVLPEASALVLGASLARALRALDARGLAIDSLAPRDVIFDSASGQATLAGLGSIRLAAGRDPARAPVLWGELMASALGAASSAGHGWLLESLAARGVRPTTASLVRDALRGDATALERALSLVPTANVAAAAREVRKRAERGLEGVVRGPSGLALAIVGPVDDPQRGVVTLAAISLRTDALVLVRSARLSIDATPEEVRDARGRIEAELDRARAERSPARIPLVRFRAATLDPALARAGSPEMRRDEAYAVYAWSADLPAASVPPLPQVKKFAVAHDARGARIAVRAAAPGRVVVVRARPGESILLPSDGDVVFDGEVPDAGAVAPDASAPESARYAAFALSAEGEPGPPLVARLDPSLEVEGVEATPGVSKATIRWKPLPASARAVIVRTAKGEPPALPDTGVLAYWGKKRTQVEVAADPGTTVAARVFLVRDDGSISSGSVARAVAWGAPDPVTELVADTTNEAHVKLGWRWPSDRSRLSGARLRRTPPFEQGELAIALDAAPSFDDTNPPLGVPVLYEVATTSAGVEARASVTALAWAELASFTAEGAGEAVSLSWQLPLNAPADATPRIVRRADRAPSDLDDGEALAIVPGSTAHLDSPFAPGAVVHYRAGLVFAGGLARSPGRVAEARVLEKAGALSNLSLVWKKKSIEVRWDEPPERVDDAVVYAGPEGKTPVPYDRASFKAGEPVRLDTPGGVLQKIKVVPRLGGREDASGAVSGEAVAWDELERLEARPGPGVVELTWSALPPGARILIKRRVDMKDAPWQELEVPAGATSLRDEPPKGKGCVYRATLVFTAGGRAVESEGIERREQARELPPELGTPAPRARSLPGAVSVTYFEPKAKVNYTGVVLYETQRSPDDVSAAFKKLGREHHLVEDLPALGLDLVEALQKDKSPAPKVDAELPARDDRPRPTTIALATRNGPIRRLVAVLRALKLPAGVLALRGSPEEKTGKPRLEWTLPNQRAAVPPDGTSGRRSAVTSSDASVKLARLELRRSLNDPDQEIPQKDRDRLEAPFAQALAEGATSFVDASADDGVTFAYTLVASFDAGQDRFEVASAPASVRGGKTGGRIVLQASQARGAVYGFKKPAVIDLVVKRDGGAGAFPAFQVLRALEGSKGEVAVASFDGGPDGPGPLKDEDLSAFTSGMTLVYTIKLSRYLEARRIEVGTPVRVKLG